MSTYALSAAKFLLPGTVKRGGYLVIRDGKIGWHQDERPAMDIVELGDSWVAPGLVDTHIHGFLGHDVMDASWEGLQAISRGLLAYGVTSWLPTPLTATVEELEEACATVASRANDEPGARMQGIFLEGPFFTEEHKGAQNPAYFANPSMDALGRWQRAAKGMVKKIAIAPERPGAPEFSAEASAAGVVVGLAHSNATIAQAEACVNAGAGIFIHTYNGMRGLDHREPAMVGAALTTHGTYAEVICDGHHVHPAAVKALVEAKGPDHVVLVTDCMRAGGMPDGDYSIGEFPVVVANGTARLKDETHNLAGSILTLDRAVRHVVDWDIVRAEEALRMATENAADANGIAGACGRILPGRDADLAVFAPDLTVRRTYLAGELVHEA